MEKRIPVLKTHKLFIGGKFIKSESDRYIEITNPLNNKKICNISQASRKDLKNAITLARSGYKIWNDKTAYERGQILYQFAEIMESKKEQFTAEIQISTGVTKRVAKKEVYTSIERIIYYAGFCDKWMQLIGSVNSVQKGYFNFSIPESIGVVGIILPDTLSLLPLISRLCIVTCTGNSCIIILNEKYPLPGLMLAEVLASSEFTTGVINILTGYKEELLSTLAGHYDVNSIDYCDNNFIQKKLIQELCSNNIKRFRELKDSESWDWYNTNNNENLKELEKFTEIKTVWHTLQ